MARPRELLSLVSIADETGISYATLRNYALKHADEIPSEGEGRNTRYPRSAVKVFQRLRRESKPGRKPKSASAPAIQPPAPAPVHPETPVRMERPMRLDVPAPAPRQAGTDTSGMEKELAAIRGFLERIAGSLEQLASAPTPEPQAAEAPVPAETRPEAPAPLTLAPAAPEAEPKKLSVPLPPIDMRGGQQEQGGHRRLHSMPKVFGQRGKRPE
jgi:hypothetical protein